MVGPPEAARCTNAPTSFKWEASVPVSVDQPPKNGPAPGDPAFHGQVPVQI